MSAPRRPSRSNTLNSLRRAAAQGVSYMPFASYPVLVPVRSSKIVPAFLVMSVIIYAALTVWNVLTQGYTIVLRPIMLDTFTNNGKTSCQPVQLNVGSSIYTSAPAGGAETAGIFQWVITGVSANLTTHEYDTAFAYKGGSMQCNGTTGGITYYYGQSAYKYGLCANCSVPTTASATTGFTTIEGKEDTNTSQSTAIVSMCSNYDVSLNQAASWAAAGQGALQQKIYTMVNPYSSLNFTNGTFPVWQWPPYGADTSPAPDDTTVTPRDVLDASVWLSGVRYLPDLIDEDGYLGMNTTWGQNHVVEMVDDTNSWDWQYYGQQFDLWDVFNHTATNGAPSGLTLAFAGLGGLAVNGPKAATWTPPEPAAVTDLRNISVSVLNYAMDAALADVHQRDITASYLCTQTEKRWKTFWSMLALILGNNAALFGMFLFLAPKLARYWDERIHGEIILPMHTTTPSRANSTIHGDDTPGLDEKDSPHSGVMDISTLPASYPSYGRQARPVPPRVDTDTAQREHDVTDGVVLASPTAMSDEGHGTSDGRPATGNSERGMPPRPGHGHERQGSLTWATTPSGGRPLGPRSQPSLP